MYTLPTAITSLYVLLVYKEVFQSMLVLGNYEMTFLWPNDKFSNRIPKWTSFVKDFFDYMLSFESDKMTALWQIETNWTDFSK